MDGFLLNRSQEKIKKKKKLLVSSVLAIRVSTNMSIEVVLKANIMDGKKKKKSALILGHANYFQLFSIIDLVNNKYTSTHLICSNVLLQ